MRSGYISINIGQLRDNGISGFGWPSTATSTHSSGSVAPSAYYLLLNATNVYSSRGPTVRWNGYPLRCLAIGEGVQAYEYSVRQKD